jgi:hypothetical protein
MQDPAMFEPKPHDEAEAMLPWYATGQLDSRERLRVEHHLLSCASCREQLTVERRIVQEVRALAPDLDSGWARMRSLIESPPASRRNGEAAAWFGHAVRASWAALARPVVVGLVTAQVAVVVIASLFVGWIQQPAYRALSSAPPPSSANVIVMFRADVSVRKADDELRGAGATIVGGPTPAGAYLLHVESRERATALSQLRSNANVQMAEQIDGGGR